MSLYIVTVLVYGAIAIVVGIPLALLTSQTIMISMVDGMLNVLIDDLSVPVHLVVIQAAVGLVLPVLAGLVPVIRGTGVTKIYLKRATLSELKMAFEKKQGRYIQD